MQWAMEENRFHLHHETRLELQCSHLCGEHGAKTGHHAGAIDKHQSTHAAGRHRRCHCCVTFGAQRALEKALEEQTAATRRAMEESLRLTGQNAALTKERDARTAEAAQTRSGACVRHGKAKHLPRGAAAGTRSTGWYLAQLSRTVRSLAQSVNTTCSEVIHALVECPPSGRVQHRRMKGAPV